MSIFDRWGTKILTKLFKKVVWPRLRKQLEEGARRREADMARTDKPMSKSNTVKGGWMAAVGAIIVVGGAFLQGETPEPSQILGAVQAVGYILSALGLGVGVQGARRAHGENIELQREIAEKLRKAG